MALPFRQQFPLVLGLVALAVHFAPELSVEQRTLGSSSLWLAAMLWNFVASPKLEAVESPPPIVWDERDDGEKFSIVMFHLLISAFAFFMAFEIASAANSPDGVVWMNIPAALIVASTVWLVWSNWKNRNAR